MVKFNSLNNPSIEKSQMAHVICTPLPKFLRIKKTSCKDSRQRYTIYETNLNYLRNRFHFIALYQIVRPIDGDPPPRPLTAECLLQVFQPRTLFPDRRGSILSPRRELA